MDKFNPDVIGEAVIEYRARHGISQMEFARQVGINHNVIVRIEHGRPTHLRSRAAVYNFLKENE